VLKRVVPQQLGDTPQSFELLVCRVFVGMSSIPMDAHPLLKGLQALGKKSVIKPRSKIGSMRKFRNLDAFCKLDC
jgi:hypothetical protein